MNMAWIKKVYLYLVSLVSLIILIIAGIMLINMALKTWVFTKADNNYYSIAPACGNVPKPPDAKPELDNSCSAENQEIAKKADAENRSAQKQRDAAQALAMIIVATPVFLYHWKLARKEV